MKPVVPAVLEGGAVAKSMLVALLLLAASTAAGEPSLDAPCHDPALHAPLACPDWVALHTESVPRVDTAGVVTDGARVFVVATSLAATSMTGILVVAMDATNGSTAWTNSRGGAVPVALAVDPATDRLYVLGRVDHSLYNSDFLALAYQASTGALLWSTSYTTGTYGRDYPLALVVSPDGETVFAGGRGGPYPREGMVMVALDAADGDVLWDVLRMPPTLPHGDGAAQALAVSANSSRLFVAGYLSQAVVATDAVVLAYDAATGDEVWSYSYHGPDTLRSDSLRAVALSPDGTRVFATGDSAGASTWPDYLTVALDPETGTSAWVQRFDGLAGVALAGGPDLALAVKPTSDGTKVVVAGSSSNLGAYGVTTKSLVVLAYDVASGALAWRHEEPLPYGTPTPVMLGELGSDILVGVQTEHRLSALRLDPHDGAGGPVATIPGEDGAMAVGDSGFYLSVDTGTAVLTTAAFLAS